jgi:hypothetical protein
MASGESIFSVMQACVLLSWYFYQEGRWVEVWIFAGFQTRVAIPLQLNFSGTFCAHNTAGSPAYLGPPKSLQDLELRRRTWWMTILFDRIVSVGGWIHGIDEKDIATELPLRVDDFELDVSDATLLCVAVLSHTLTRAGLDWCPKQYANSDHSRFVHHTPSSIY